MKKPIDLIEFFRAHDINTCDLVVKIEGIEVPYVIKDLERKPNGTLVLQAKYPEITKESRWTDVNLTHLMSSDEHKYRWIILKALYDINGGLVGPTLVATERLSKDWNIPDSDMYRDTLKYLRDNGLIEYLQRGFIRATAWGIKTVNAVLQNEWNDFITLDLKS